MRRVFAASLLFMCAAPAIAADEVKLPDTFWQKVTGAGWVDFDPDANPVFHLETGYYFAKTGKLVKYRDGKPAPAFFDRAGRVWAKEGSEPVVHLWTGTEWQKHAYKAQHLFSASDGRVFLFDGTHIRVFDKEGKWTAQQISRTPREGKIDFLEHDNRVWAWAWGHGNKYESGIGAWSLQDGKWTHYTTTNGFYYQSTHCIHPVADGRLMVFDYQPPGHGRSPPYYWHPDKKIPPNEMKVLPKLGVHGGGEVAYGTDGTLYFGSGPGGNNGWLAIDAKGTVHELPKHVGLVGLPHAVVNGRRIMFHKLGDTPPVLPGYAGDFVGADRDGRFYFAAHTVGWKSYGRGQVVTAIMPKQEKPGEVLRLEPEKVVVRDIVTDDTGKLWGEPVGGGALLQWHAGKWIDTPIQSLYYPGWTARSASPWSQWRWRSNQLFRLHGNNGSLLVVRIRDRYQLDEPAKDENRFPPRVVNDPKFPHPAPPPPVARGGERPLYWLEAFLFRDGKWTGPTEIRKLLETEHASLLKDFPTTSGGLSFFGLVHDGTRLWAAFDGTVLTIEKGGKLVEADWPLTKPKDPLPYLMLSRLSDGKALLSRVASDGYTLAVAEGKIATMELKMPGNSPAVNPNEAVARWHLAKDNTLWHWIVDRSGYTAHVWHYRNGQWAEKKELGAPFHTDADGNLWCFSTQRELVQVKVVIANGTESKVLTFSPDEMQLGLTAIPKGAVTWATGDRLYSLDPHGFGGKPVLRWRLLSATIPGQIPAVIDSKATVLLGAHRGELGK